MHNLELYYSINELVKDYNIENLIQDNEKDSFSQFRAQLWGSNHTNYGEIIFELEIKYDSSMNYYTSGKLCIILDNTIEFAINEESCKIIVLTTNYNLLSVDGNYNIIIEPFIHNNNLCSLVKIFSK
jgi:hypothetical protein